MMQKFSGRVLLLFPLIISAVSAFSQNPDNDLALIYKNNFANPVYVSPKTEFMKTGNRNVCLKYNPVSLSLNTLMFFYQKVLSHQISSGCPYEISCSNFSKALISEFGYFKGIFLTADRLLRCNRMALMDIRSHELNSGNKIIDNPENYHIHH